MMGFAIAEPILQNFALSGRFGLIAPFLPVRRIDFNRSPGCRINIGLTIASAGENQGMDDSSAVDDRKTNVAVRGHISQTLDWPPFHKQLTAQLSIYRFDLAQSATKVSTRALE